uniref:Uncharacterized protein n=1 Tax=Leptobrachium leishanense TaxID=445787 RepID=A0A8C5QPP8_9ANUR
MAPPKAQRCLDPPVSARKVKAREPQDGGAIGTESPKSTEGIEDASVTSPAASNPASEGQIRALLSELRDTLQADFRSIVADLHKDISDLGDRTDQLETKTDDLCLAHNELVDAFKTLQNSQDLLQRKVADLEDRSRRNNIRIRGIPEAVKSEDLHDYALHLFRTLLPSTPDAELCVDRIHRVSKPKNLAATGPRDVLVWVHFFKIKEELMATVRKMGDLPDPYASILFFPDLSAATMAKRREFSSFTKILWNHKMPYRWDFPTKLLIWRMGTLHAVPDAASGFRLMKEWDLTGESTPPQASRPTPTKVSPEWHRVNTNK